MTNATRLRLIIALSCAGGFGQMAEGATYVPVTDASLVDRARLVIIGKIEGVAALERHTVYRVLVERVLKGVLDQSVISVSVPGNETFLVPGMPHFTVGQRAILFLARHRDGTFRLVELMLGAFREHQARDSSGTFAQRDLAEATSLGEPQTEPARDFEEFAAWIEARARGERAVESYVRPAAELMAQETDREASPFTLLGTPPGRWIQFDSGGSVPWVIRLGGSALAGGGVTALQTVLSAYNTQPNTIFNLPYNGTNAGAQGFSVDDGLNAVLMNDPFGDIAGAFNCGAGGVLAVGGFSTLGTHTYKGTTHRTILEGDIVTQDGADCAFLTFSQSYGAQVLAHEMGHAVGMGHSCGDTASGTCTPGTVQDDALMRATAHNDSRGAQFGSDDIAGLVRLYERITTGSPTISSFTADKTFVNPSGAVTLSWTASFGAALTLNGATVSGPTGSMVVNPTSNTTYTLVATANSTSVTKKVIVFISDGTAGLGAPTVTTPSSGQVVTVTGVGFSWTSVGGATGYDLRVFDGSTGSLIYSGSLLGVASTSTLVSLGAGSYQFATRACSGGFSGSLCGPYGSVAFTVTPTAPTGAPTITFPAQGANLTTSTQTFSWSAVAPNSGMSYEVLLRDLSTTSTALQITVPAPNLSTIFTMKSSTQYELKVRACQAACGPYSTAVTFAVTLPGVPVSGPSIVSCSVSSGNSLACSWSGVANADAYQIQVVQAPPAGPGGGALTVAARQVSTTTVTLSVPVGAATVFITACNGNGCGPNTTSAVNAAGPNPSQSNIGTPMAGTVVTGPGVLFTWNRVPGDNGSNTNYRLFVQDLSRQATALDVFTTSNFYSAFFKAEGARYDALVVSNPGLGSAVTGPSQGFNVAGASATAPTMVSPAHNSTVSSGNLQLGWSPVPGATLYEYFVAVLGQGSASARGVTPGLIAQVPLTGTGAGTVYSGIVRACPAGATCVSGSDAGWGPFSNAPGGPGVTNFTVVP